MPDKKDAGELRHKILTIVGIVLCVILIPMLIVNCTLLIKGWINEDEVPDFGGYIPLIVLTNSMEDIFPGGSVIVSKTISPEEIADGDIISYFDPASKTGAVVTHKVKFIKTDENGGLVFYTYGTANVKKPHEEVVETDCEAIPAECLVGIYTGFRIKGMGSAAMFMQTTTGLIVCVFVPLVALVAYDIIRRRLYEKQHEGDKDELLRELEELRKLKAAQDAEQLGVESGDVSTESVELRAESGDDPADNDDSP